VLFHEAPSAQSPQRVISKIKFWGSKNCEILQPVEGQLPTGIPKVEVSIVLALLDSELGISDLGKNQMFIPVEAISVTKAPPPLLAKPAP
jgi:hypothetical protein